MPGVEIRILYSYHQRRRKEENMQQESERLNQENKLLKQSEELRALREKEALLRESLFRRMSVIHKIPSLEENKNPNNDNQKIVLTEEDWEEIRTTVDGSYNQFTKRLLSSYPQLSQIKH